jgi:hypothetical protein
MKIQQMAFMLIAVTVFFSMIALIYFSLTFAGIKQDAERLQEEEAILLTQKLSGTPELLFAAQGDCKSCIDLDKALALSEKKEEYARLWNLDYLVIEKLYPATERTINPDGECSRTSYPDECFRITIVNDTSSTRRNAKESFVTLARYDHNTDKYVYEFGRILASPRRRAE